MQKPNKIVGDYVEVQPLYMKRVLRRGPLPIIGEVPDGCYLHLCEDDKAWPFLCCGDLAVIDPNQKFPRENDLLLHRGSWGNKISLIRPWRIGLSSPNEYVYIICRPADSTDFEDLETWSAHPNFYRRPRLMQATVDGPCGPEWFAHYSIGLVVGAFASQKGDGK